MGIISDLEKLKQHTYTPNSFYTLMKRFVKNIANGDFNITLEYEEVTGADLTAMNAGGEISLTVEGA